MLSAPASISMLFSRTRMSESDAPRERDPPRHPLVRRIFPTYENPTKKNSQPESARNAGRRFRRFGVCRCNVRFPPNYVRCTSESRRSSPDGEWLLLLRVVGHLSHTDGAASSGGRCPTSLRGGTRGPATLGGAVGYGDCVVARCERIASHPSIRFAAQPRRRSYLRLHRR